VKLARTLFAVQQFKDGEYLTSLRSLAELEVNPARVLGFYPELISGRLSVPQERWVELFGGKSPTSEDGKPSSPTNAQLGSPDPGLPEDEAKVEGTGKGGAMGVIKAIEGYIPISGKKNVEDSVADTKEDAVVEQIQKKPEGRYLSDQRVSLTDMLEHRAIS
jgi:Vam6/Vps39-like protein vacuolar protein sorting-associated protein 39